MRFQPKFDTVLTKEFLEKEYVENNTGPYNIAKLIGTTAATVYSYLKKHNIIQVDKNKLDVTGQQFYQLTAIRPTTNKAKNGTVIWECVCTCGNKTNVPVSALKRGNIKSCGCRNRRQKSNNPLWKGHGDFSGSKLGDIIWRAKKKNMEFNLDVEFLSNLIKTQNGICAISGLPISLLDKSASLDRIDSQKGYTTDNVWWVHRDVNKMKMDLPLDRFLTLCKVIATRKDGA